MKILGQGVKYAESLQVLDLSFCGIQDKHSYYLARLLREQSEEAERKVWQLSLRPDITEIELAQQNDQPQPVKGLTEFIFHHNKLS